MVCKVYDTRHMIAKPSKKKQQLLKAAKDARREVRLAEDPTLRRARLRKEWKAKGAEQKRKLKARVKAANAKQNLKRRVAAKLANAEKAKVRRVEKKLKAAAARKEAAAAKKAAAKLTVKGILAALDLKITRAEIRAERVKLDMASGRLSEKELRDAPRAERAAQDEVKESKNLARAIRWGMRPPELQAQDRAKKEKQDYDRAVRNGMRTTAHQKRVDKARAEEAEEKAARNGYRPPPKKPKSPYCPRCRGFGRIPGLKESPEKNRPCPACR